MRSERLQNLAHPWGEPLWSFPIPVTSHPLTDGLRVDVAIVGAGFTGLATAHYVRQLCPGWHVAVFETQQGGNGASGRPGSLVLEGTAVDALAGAENCFGTLQELVSTQGIQCDLRVDGCWEIGRQHALPTSPIQWSDQGTLQVVYEIPGGAFDPRKFLAGLAEIVQRAEGQIFEHAPVTGLDIERRGGVRLTVAGHAVYAQRAVVAPNPWCLLLLGLHNQAEGVHTVAVATEPLADAVFDAIGWATRTPFYTLDLPYLWGRVTADGCAVIGGGTVGRGNVDHARADAPEAVRLYESLERRIRGLHPALSNVRITHRWMGPLCAAHN